MVLLVTEQNMVEQWAVTRQEGAGYLKSLRVEVLWLLRLLSSVKARDLWDLLLELDDESDLGGDAKVANDNEADALQECVPSDLLLIPSMRDQVLLLDGADLHDVPYVQSRHPLSLIQETKHMSHVDEVD